MRFQVIAGRLGLVFMYEKWGIRGRKELQCYLWGVLFVLWLKCSEIILLTFL